MATAAAGQRQPRPDRSTVSYCYNPDGYQTAVVYGDGDSGRVAACEIAYPWVVSSASYPTQAAYQTTYGIDSAGEVVSTTTPATAAAPSGGTTSWTYDPAGNELTTTDADGVKATWTVTSAGLPGSESFSGSSAHSVSFGYDADGNKTSTTDVTGTSSYMYDSFGEPTSATNGDGQTISYGYNPDGKIASVTYPLPSGATWAASKNVTYGYDNADLLTSITDFNGNKITIGDTADGLPDSAALGSTGDTITTTYDPTDTASAITLKNSSSTLQSFSYANSPAGTIVSETDTPSSSQSPAVYTYDAKGRVTSMTPGTGSVSDYGFDASSNMATLPTGAAGSYNDAGELTTSVLSGATTTYTYNADGQQLTAKQGATTVSSGTWNGAGQLTAYDSSAADMTAATYDGTGMRATSTTASGTQDYVWDTTAKSDPQLLMDSANAYIYTSSGTPAEQVNLSTGTITYLVADSLGSVRGTVSSTGSLTATTSYDAWGNPLTTGGLTASTPFGYAGGYTDPTGLIYLLDRYYSPTTGQFLSVDPELSQTLAPYGYASGNPVSNTDPTGMKNATVAQRDDYFNWSYQYWYADDFSRWHTPPCTSCTPDFWFNSYVDFVNCCTLWGVDQVFWQTYMRNLIYYWTPVNWRLNPWGWNYWRDIEIVYFQEHYELELVFPAYHRWGWWSDEDYYHGTYYF